MKITVLLAALGAVLFASNADARPRHTSLQKMQIASGCSDPVMRPCEVGFGSGIFSEEITRKSLRHRHFRADSGRKGITHHNTTRVTRMSPGLARVMAEGAGRVVSHPTGCPRRAFCGCGAAVRIFGKPIRSLWLAANWFRFPRTSPAPGTVAIRRDGHHVVVLERQISGSTWLVYDANSGRHRTRVHPRSIAGYVIVDPRTGA